jgi:hypothetical protein
MIPAIVPRRGRGSDASSLANCPICDMMCFCYRDLSRAATKKIKPQRLTLRERHKMKWIAVSRHGRESTITRYLLSVLMGAAGVALAGSPHRVPGINSAATPLGSNPLWLGTMGNFVFLPTFLKTMTLHFPSPTLHQR